MYAPPRAQAALHKGEVLWGDDGRAYVSVLEELRWDIDGRRVPHVVSRYTWQIVRVPPAPTRPFPRPRPS